MALQNLSGQRAAAVLSMAEWPSETRSTMLDEFLQLPVEFVLTQSFFFTDRISAEHELRQEHRRISVNDQHGAAEADKSEIAQGLQDLASGRTVNGLHHLSLLAHVESDPDSDTPEGRRRTLAKLDAAVSLVKKAFVNLHVKPVREWLAMETFYWAQLPGQSPYFIGRRGKIKSSNFAGFASLHNFATGKIDGNLWGPAIMPFETASGSAYHFNFHREIDGMVAGHTAIGADTGAGKTTLISALITMADKAKPRLFWFDHREGARVHAWAIRTRPFSSHAATCGPARTSWPTAFSARAEGNLHKPAPLPEAPQQNKRRCAPPLVATTRATSSAASNRTSRAIPATSKKWSVMPEERRQGLSCRRLNQIPRRHPERTRAVQIPEM